MKLAIVGSRKFTDYNLFRVKLDYILLKYNLNVTEFVSGGARGTDTLIEDYGKEIGIPVKVFEPNWRPNGVYDRTAGFKRNRDIWEYADSGVAFWDGKSTGTADSFKIVEKIHKDLIVFNYIDSTIKLLKFSTTMQDW